MQLLTLSDAKASRLPGIVGKCADSPEFLDFINKATRMLMVRGEFDGLVVKLQLCVEAGCVVWPAEVGTVLAANVCGHAIQAKNNWFEFLPNNGGSLRPNSSCGVRVMEMEGRVPVFRNIGCEASYVRAFLQRNADIGKTITIYGIDDNGNELMTLRADDTYLPGVTLSLAKPYAQTPMKLRKITRIQKDVTQGPITVYSSALGDGTDLRQLGLYRPRDTNPMFRATGINTFRSTGCCGCHGAFKSIMSLVKLQFVPVELDDDVIQISNLDALEEMIRSIKFGDAFDGGQKKEFEAAAIREMNLELGSNQPLEQVSIRVSGFGTALPRRHGIGRMR